jgi:hypothetical protein
VFYTIELQFLERIKSVLLTGCIGSLRFNFGWLGLGAPMVTLLSHGGSANGTALIMFGIDIQEFVGSLPQRKVFLGMHTSCRSSKKVVC